MKNFTNNRKVNFEELEKSGIYSSELLQDIKNGNYKDINKYFKEHEKKDKNFMEPLLYAVKNEYGTCAIFEHYGENLKGEIVLPKNRDLATDIIKEDPELIRGTTAGANEEFVLEMAKVNPKVISCMSEELKSNSEFTERLCQLQVKEITIYAAKECEMPDTIIQNPHLAKDEAFMVGAISKDINSLKYADESLKNNPEFLEQICKENEEVIKYVSNNTEEFGKESLKATQTVLRKKFNQKISEECKEEVEEIKEEIEQKEKEGTVVETKLIGRKTILEKRPEVLDKRLAGLENGDEKAIKYARRILKVCKNLDEDYREMIEQSLRIGEAIVEKQKEETTKKEEKKISTDQVEVKTEGAGLNGIREEITVTREELQKEYQMQVGENTNEDKSNDERS